MDLVRDLTSRARAAGRSGRRAAFGRQGRRSAARGRWTRAGNGAAARRERARPRDGAGKRARRSPDRSPHVDQRARRRHRRGSAPGRVPARSGGRGHEHVEPTERPTGRSHAHPPRGDHGDLRVAPQCHRRRGRAVPQEWQRHATPRGFRGDPLQPGHRRAPVRCHCGVRSLDRCGPARTEDGPRNRRPPARAGRRDRPGHSQRRRGTHSQGFGKVAHPGNQALRRSVSRVSGRIR